MDYSFEEFNAEGGRFTPLISLGEAGGIGVSAGFVKKYPEIKDAAGVKLLFDKGKNAIGVKFLQQKEPGMLAFKVVPRGGGYINGKAFLVKFDIDPKKYKGRYPVKEIIFPDQSKAHVIELKERTIS